MRVGFDGTTLQAGQTGIGYYTEHLLRHLAEISSEAAIELFLLSHRRVNTQSPLPPQVVQVPDLRFGWRSLWMQALAPRVLQRTRAQIAHFTNSLSPLFTSVPTVLTIHDMSLDLFPAYHPWRRQLTRPLIRLCARKATALITVSENSRRDIIRGLNVPADRVHVIREAAAPCFAPCNEPALLQRMRDRYQLEANLILHVGTIEPRKNLPRLIRAFKVLRRQGFSSYQLVCAGPYGWGMREVERAIEECELRESVRLLGYVPFSDLSILYNLATVFVFPSIYEGFGLPALEAMACGVPVVTSRNSALLEFGENCAEWVDPEQWESIHEALHSLLQDPDRRLELRMNGLQVAENYSWKRAARETLDLYRASASSAE